MHAKSLQSCPTLCDPMNSSPPGFPVHGILQARILEWVATSISIVIYSHTKFFFVQNFKDKHFSGHLNTLLENSFKYNFPFEGEDLVVVCTVNSGGKSLSTEILVRR